MARFTATRDQTLASEVIIRVLMQMIHQPTRNLITTNKSLFTKIYLQVVIRGAQQTCRTHNNSSLPHRRRLRCASRHYQKARTTVHSRRDPIMEMARCTQNTLKMEMETVTVGIRRMAILNPLLKYVRKDRLVVRENTTIGTRPMKMKRPGDAKLMM